MPFTSALNAARAQLQYWRKECHVAHLTPDASRIEQCERFIAQMELVVAALTEAQAGHMRLISGQTRKM